jgi:hypothetical protein
MPVPVSGPPPSDVAKGRVKVRAVRARGERFDPRFFEADPRFWPVARAASCFVNHTTWPRPEEYSDAFAGRPHPVRFVSDPPNQRRRGPVDFAKTYDGRIEKGEVPTRPGMWHDFLNALVWATFPRAKAALHRRQHLLFRGWAEPGAARLPNARTREQDALALVDEGGIVVLDGSNGSRTVTFGHALFEGLVHGTPAMIARAVPLSIPRLPAAETLLEVVDGLLAARLAEPMLPEELPRARF